MKTLYLCCPALKFTSNTLRTANSFLSLKASTLGRELFIKTLFLSSHESDKSNKYVLELFDYVYTAPPKGVYAAFNAAINYATGLGSDWIWLLGEGDTILTENIDLPALANNLASSESDLISMNMLIGDRKSICKSKNSHVNPLFNLDTMRFNHPACIVAAKAYSAIGLYSTQYKVVSDYYWLHRLCDSNLSLVRIPCLAAYHERGGISTSEMKSVLKEHIQCLKVLYKVYGISLFFGIGCVLRASRYLVHSLLKYLK